MSLPLHLYLCVFCVSTICLPLYTLFYITRFCTTLFFYKREAHSMSALVSTSASTLNSVWFVDSGASNHMTSHEEWFQELRKPEHLGYVETGDDRTHPIEHIGNVPFRNDGKQTYLKNVLHVLTIMKNLFLV